MTKKRIKYMIMLFILVIIGSIWGLRTYKNMIAPKEEFKVYTEGNFDLSLYGKNNQYILITPKETDGREGAPVSNNYVMTSEAKLRMDEEADDETYEEGEYDYLYLYDINNNFKKEKIDIVKLFSEHNLSGFLTQGILTYQGKDYVFLSLTKDGKKTIKLLDIKTKELSEVPEGILYGDYLDNDAGYIDFWHNTKIYEILEEHNGMHIGVNYKTFYLEKYGKEVPDLEGTNLAQEEPELAKALENGGSLSTRSEMVDTGTWINTLMHWFAPQGQDVLELYATAEDGTKTQIKSYEDFVAWRQEHPKE